MGPKPPHSTRLSPKEEASIVACLPDVEGDKPVKKRFKPCPIGDIHIDIAKAQTAQGRLPTLCRH